MITVLFVLIAAVGAIIRAVVTSLDASFNRQLAGTLAVNLVGAFLLGLLYGSSTNTLLVVGVGGLGSLTTFSTFIAQVECIQREGKTSDAALYLLGAAIAGVTMAWIGWTLA